MFNNTTFVGYIISAEEPRFSSEQFCLEVKISSKTGEKKKEGEQYDPAHVLSFLLWGRYAETMKPLLTPRTLVAVTGQLGTPNIYKRKDESYGYTLRFTNNKVESIRVLSRPTEDFQDNKSSSQKDSSSYSALARETFGDFEDDFEDDFGDDDDF